METNELGKRLSKLMAEKQLTQTELASKVGVKRQSVYKWVHGISAPKGDNLLRKVADALDVAPSYLFFGEDQAFLSDKANSSDDGYVSIPYLDISGSCGGGEEGNDAPPLIKLIRVSRPWLNQNAPSANWGRLKLIGADGDSMLPTIAEGDVVLIDTAEQTIRSDAIYCLRRFNDLFIKRVQRIPGGYRMISDNSKYPPVDVLGGEQENFAIIGRVRCVGCFRLL